MRRHDTIAPGDRVVEHDPSDLKSNRGKVLSVGDGGYAMVRWENGRTSEIATHYLERVASGFSEMAERVAARHIEAAGTHDLRWKPGTAIRGTGQDDGYTLTVLNAVPTTGGNYHIEGYLWKGPSGGGGPWVAYTGTFGRTSRNPPPRFSGGKLDEPAMEGRVRRLLRAGRDALLATLEEVFPPSESGATPSYRGTLPVQVLGGKHRTPLTRDMGWHEAHRHNLHVTKPSASGEQAERDLTESGRKYQQDTFPGGMVTQEALVYWRDLGTWSGVYETYYSFS